MCVCTVYLWVSTLSHVWCWKIPCWMSFVLAVEFDMLFEKALILENATILSLLRALSWRRLPCSSCKYCSLMRVLPCFLLLSHLKSVYSQRGRERAIIRLDICLSTVIHDAAVLIWFSCTQSCCCWTTLQKTVCHQSLSKQAKLSVMDVLAQSLMKSTAKCDKHCELQNSVNQQNLEHIKHSREIPGSIPASVSLVPISEAVPVRLDSGSAHVQYCLIW